MRLFVEHWVTKEETFSQDEEGATEGTTLAESSAWNLLMVDKKYLEEQIEQHARSLEALNPIITALVQLTDSHKSISQAEDVRRLTYIAMAFIPLSFLTGIFSMSELYGPGNDRFWIYWAFALPIVVLIMGIVALHSRLSAVSIFRAKMQTKAKGSSSPTW